MRAVLRCNQCNTATAITDEPRQLLGLECSCGVTADARAVEDLASAIEDALAQLWHIGKTFELRLELGTDSIPAAFTPEPGDSSSES